MISLPDINFKENTTHLLTSSINALRQINDFMVKNPKAVIEIRGHVNAPGYDNEGKVKRFSEKRAEEVKNFLVGMGIDGRRIKTAGMGNEQMLYPNPSNYQQEKANRRVEIVILED
jgi:outer membrane protein OmpA-like peptidoglycan-associated protein